MSLLASEFVSLGYRQDSSQGTGRTLPWGQGAAAQAQVEGAI